MDSKPFFVLSLDGGGAKGFYSLGVLKEVEALLGNKISDHFGLIYGTSTGSIIAALLGLGHSVDSIHALYKEHIAKIVGASSPAKRSKALATLADEVFGDSQFTSMQTRVGIVTARWVEERPMIFKGDVEQAFGRQSSFVPGFGATVKDAVEASCSAYPLFDRKVVSTAQGNVELVDGGYCANNPTLYAILEATTSLRNERDSVRVLSVGVGEYPAPARSIWQRDWWVQRVPHVKLLQKTFEFSSRSMEQLRSLLFSDIQTVRVNDVYTVNEMATDMLETDQAQLDLLWQRGRQSFGNREAEIRQLLGAITA